MIPSFVAAQQDTARRVDSTKHVTIAPIIVTASRDPMPQNRLGLATSVLTAADLIAEPARSVGDALHRLPGVFMDATAGPDGPSNIRLRGGDESFTKVLMDGVEVNFSGGPFEFEGITAHNVGRIEVVRGPQSALHGSSAMTGVVQLFTAAGAPGVPRWSITTEGGSAAVHGDHGRGTFEVSGGSEVVRYSAGLGAMYDEGVFAVPHRLLTRDASARLDIVPGGPLTITSAVRFYDMSSHLPVRDPGATVVPLDSNQRTSHNVFTGAMTATYVPSADWRHELKLTLLHDGFEYADLADSITADSTALANATGIQTANGDIYLHQDLLRPTLSYSIERRFAGADGRVSSVTAGAAIEREIANDTVGNFQFGQQTPGRRNHGSLFTEVNAAVSPTLTVLAGARLESYEGLALTAVPRVSVAYAVADHMTLRAAVGRGFKAANLEQQLLNVGPFVPNPDLKPESSWSWEIGTTVATPGGLHGAATFFHQAFYDLIRTVPLDASHQTIKNLGQSNASGVEMEAGYTAPSGVSASANVSWVRTSVVDNVGLDPTQYPVDSVLPFRPALTAGAALDVPMGRFRAVARGTVIGSEVVLTARFQGSRTSIDPYGLVGLTLTYDVTPGISLYTRGDNLLNTAYLAGFDRRGEPRTWTVGLRVTN